MSLSARTASFIVCGALVGGCWGSGTVEATMGGTAMTGPDGSTVVIPSGPDLRVVVPEPLHRLNRLEYNNTVRDLLGTTLTPADAFPPDPVLEGFDNVANILNLPPSLFALYADAARALSEGSLHTRPRYTQTLDAQALGMAGGQGGFLFENWAWSIDGSFKGKLQLALDERVTLSLLVGGFHTAGTATPVITLKVDGAALKTWTVTASPSAPVVLSVATNLTKGTHAVELSFDNRYNQPAENEYNQVVLGYVQAVSDATVVPGERAAIYTCEPSASQDPDACYRRIVTGFAQRAWRRPLSPEEADAVSSLWQRLAVTEGKDEAVTLSVRGVLLSSKFTYRPSFEGPAGKSPFAQWRPLDDHVLASRLSYFLWSSMPDEALLADAAAGVLRTNEGLAAAVQRMLKDPKVKGLRNGFAGSWLGLRALRTASPDKAHFPAFDEALREAMSDESELFFDDFLRNGLPLRQMLTPSFGFLNDRLALHYGVPLPGKSTLTRVELPAGARRGLLMQGAWLTAMSDPLETSPVRRGRFVLEQLLGEHIPPPPPGVPVIPLSTEGLTMRQRLAKHREDPKCASCHNTLDPVGLGLEEFDAIGTRRDTEEGRPVDASGALSPDRPFNGATEMAALVQKDPRFQAALVRKLFAYALGRELVPDDEGFIAEVEQKLAKRGDRLDALIELIVLSPNFRMHPEASP